MDTITFFKKILPTNGFYCIVVLKKDGLRQHFVDNIEAAAKIALEWDAAGYTVYYSTASLIETGNRKTTNAQALRALRLDIDCGPGKAYPTKRDGVKAVFEFQATTGLPDPLLTDSGGGVHAYWPLDADIPPHPWLDTSSQLKQLCGLYRLHADPVVTADIVRILRPVGTHNRKDTPKQITLLQDAPQYDFDTISSQIRQAIQCAGEHPVLGSNRAFDDNDDLSSGIEYPPAYADMVADKCKQISNLRDVKGNVSEPVWYAAIGLLRHCDDGVEKIHAWSSGHPHYSKEDTDDKIQHHVDSNVGPTSCKYFQSINEESCKDCVHAGKVTSPIQLGHADPEPAVHTDVIDKPAPPKLAIDYVPFGFRRADDGKLYHKTEQGWQEFSKYDVVPTHMERDEKNDILVNLHVSYPVEGRRELKVPMASLAEPKELRKFLYSKGICLTSKEDTALMGGYLIRYLDNLQNSKAPIQAYQQMGWRDASTFIWGEQVINAHEIKKARLSTSIPDNIKGGFTESGSLAEWRKAIDAYSLPGMEGYAFGFLCAPGAVLLRFTPYRGVVLSLVSPQPGEGKSTIQKAINSFFGDPVRTCLQAKDTVLAQYNRLSMYQNIAATVDEITVMNPDQLSEFVYQIPQGRQRIRLTRDATEKQNALEWSTIVVTSSNQSLAAKLATLKHSAEAENVRIFEYYIKHPRSLKKHEADKLFSKLDTNYGVAGPVFIQHIINHWDEVAALIAQIQEKIDIEANVQSMERFWSALIAVNIAGGIICNQLGLTKFNIKALYKWALIQLDNLRGVMHESGMDARMLLGSYLNEVQNAMLVVDRAADSRKGIVSTVKVAPHTALHCRVEQDVGKAWINRDHIRKWLIARFADYNDVLRELSAEGVLVHSAVKKSLGVGTYYTTTPVACWELDIDKSSLHLVVDNDTSHVKLDTATKT